MLYLVFSILSSASLLIVFKFFEKYKVNNLKAIVINYFSASILGFLIGGIVPAAQVIDSVWFWHSVFTGAVFVLLFYLIAYTAQNISITVASVSNKMSVVIPVIASYFLFGDSFNIIKIVGILLALVGVYFAALKSGERFQSQSLKYWSLPIVLFLANGLVDTYLKYVQLHFLSASDSSLFIPYVFLAAFFTGVVVLAFKKDFAFQKQDIIGGLALGVPNFFSIFFLLKSLEIPYLQSSVVFPINNVGVVLASALLAFFIFKEQFSRKNIIGIGLCLLAIVLIAFA